MFQIKDMMNGVLLHTASSESLVYVANLLYRNNADAIIVRDKGMPVGIITSKDIIKALITIDKSPDEIRALDMMNAPIVVVDHEDNMEMARKIMVSRGLRKLPVRKGPDIIGLLVQEDFIRDMSWINK